VYAFVAGAPCQPRFEPGPLERRRSQPDAEQVHCCADAEGACRVNCLPPDADVDLDRFGFGANWERFARVVNESQLKAATRSLTEMLVSFRSGQPADLPLHDRAWNKLAF